MTDDQKIRSVVRRWRTSKLVLILAEKYEEAGLAVTQVKWSVVIDGGGPVLLAHVVQEVARELDARVGVP